MCNLFLLDVSHIILYECIWNRCTLVCGRVALYLCNHFCVNICCFLFHSHSASFCFLFFSRLLTHAFNILYTRLFYTITSIWVFFLAALSLNIAAAVIEVFKIVKTKANVVSVAMKIPNRHISNNIFYV